MRTNRITSGADLGTILGVRAHPDDEAFLSAGIMAMAAKAGARVVCVTGTRGEMGAPEPGHAPSEVGRIREAEIRASLDHLGVCEHHRLDYLDGCCALVDQSEAVSKVGGFIDQVYAFSTE